MYFTQNTFIKGQIRTAPKSLGTTTIATHQGVGSSTGEMTFKVCIHCNSVYTFVCNGRGIFLGELNVNGWGFGFNLIVYSCPNFPRSVNIARGATHKKSVQCK